MYMAQALNEQKFSVDDLPNSIVMTYVGPSGTTYGPFNLNRDETGNFSAAPPLDEVQVLYTAGGARQGFWAMADGGGGIGNSYCLILNNNDVGSGYIITIDDNFADTYSITGPREGTVTRNKDEDLCLWSGANLNLRYNGGIKIDELGFPIPTGSFKFSVNGNPKIGLQNTPVGSYEGGYSVS